MSIRRLLLGLAVLVALSAALGYVGRGWLGTELARRLAPQRMAADVSRSLPDGLHVGLCGTGSPFPDEQRSGPCTWVLAGQRLMVIDAGGGAARMIGRMGVNQGRIDAILLTHFHSDHLDGLGELLLQRWVAGAHTAPIPVHGPPGVETVIAGLMQAYSQDRNYRVAHHGEQTVPSGGFGASARPFVLDAQGRAVVMKDADLEVIAFAVDHAPAHPAVGYRIHYKDRVVVLSGDTKPSAAVAREAQGADLLIHEALSPELVGVLREAAITAGRANLRKVFEDIPDYHTTPEQAARLAADAKVGLLVFNHIVPNLPLPGMRRAFMGDAARLFGGPIRIGEDGDRFSLLPGSRTTDHHHRLQ